MYHALVSLFRIDGFSSFMFLFPGLIKKFKSFNSLPFQDLYQYGLIEKTPTKNNQFVHLTLAEYLVAWFVIENKDKKYVDFILRIILKTEPSMV